MLTRAWIAANLLRRRLARPFEREQLVREHAPGRSFLDVGCMWSIDGRIAFLAEEAGARQVTGIDLIGRTDRFEAEHARRRSRVRFVHGDLHDPDVVHAAGRHDVVWCTGLLYHSPNPLLTLDRLADLCGDTLILGSETLPELPGVRGGCVFYPALSDRERRAYRRVPGGSAVGLTSPYEPDQGFGNWFWGITPSALAGMIEAAGFEARRWVRRPFHTFVVATPRRAASR